MNTLYQVGLFCFFFSHKEQSASYKRCLMDNVDLRGLTGWRVEEGFLETLAKRKTPTCIFWTHSALRKCVCCTLCLSFDFIYSFSSSSSIFYILFGFHVLIWVVYQKQSPDFHKSTLIQSLSFSMYWVASYSGKGELYCILNRRELQKSHTKGGWISSLISWELRANAEFSGRGKPTQDPLSW